jgi:hypothetical protein
LSKQTNKQGIGKTEQQGNKKEWKQQAYLNINNVNRLNAQSKDME